MEKRVLAARQPALLPHQLCHQAARLDPTQQKDAEVAMEWGDEVAIPQWRTNPCDDRLLAGTRIDSPEDFVLPMQARNTILEGADQLHPEIQTQLEFDAGGRVRRHHHGSAL